MTVLPVVEKFVSIDGEGHRAGALACFIRLAGCNLRCSYCDTDYALSTCSGVYTDIKSLVQFVANARCKYVTITGGEPLIHRELLELVRALVMAGGQVNIETNGSLPFSQLQLEGVTITCDYKLPSSGMHEHNNLAAIRALRTCDVLKFVAASCDFADIRRALLALRPGCQVFISPVFGKCRPVEIVSFMQDLRTDPEFDDLIDRIRLQVQLHKIVWDPDAKGV